MTAQMTPVPGKTADNGSNDDSRILYRENPPIRQYPPYSPNYIPLIGNNPIKYGVSPKQIENGNSP
jgi:hypothetical protein